MQNPAIIRGYECKFWQSREDTVTNSPHRKKHLSSDARVMRALLKKQPQGADELRKNARIPIRTSYFLIPFLIDSRIIKETSGGYALWDYDDTEEAVVQTIKKWRKIAFCDPLPAEIANETGMSPQEVENVARKTSNETGWMLPNQAVQDSATEKLGEVLGYLARKRDGKLKDFDYRGRSRNRERSGTRSKRAFRDVAKA